MANQTKLALFFKTSSCNPPSSSLGKHPLNSSEDELEDEAELEDSHDDAADEDEAELFEDSHDDAADEDKAELFEDSHDDAADEDETELEDSHADIHQATSASGTRFQSTVQVENFAGHKISRFSRY